MRFQGEPNVHVPDIEIHEATTLDEATTLMSQYAPDARLLAGGTDLVVDLKTGRVCVRHVVSLRRIEALRGAIETEQGLRIGALTTVTQLSESPVVRERFAALLDATSRMAAAQVRNLATVGGNVASAVPCADLPPILTAMDASVVLWSPRGEREVPLDEFFTGPRETIRRDDEVLTTILVPRPPSGSGAAYARFGLRDGNTIAVAAVAAGVQLAQDDTLQRARIVLGAVAPIPKLAKEASAHLDGKCVKEDAFRRAADLAMQSAEPIADVRGSVEFRRDLVGVLTQRALMSAQRRAKRGRP
jgi:CO/xanthine dehydrogenase FAD-binding subunit